MQTKRCTKCGVEKPRTSEYFNKHKQMRDGLRPACKLCQAMDGKDYRKKHLGKLREYNTRYYKEHKEERNEKGKCHYRENIEEYQRRHKRYREEHLIDEYEQHKRYREEHPEKSRDASHRHRAKKRTLPSTFTDADWIAALEYFNYSCAYCGCNDCKLQQEHVIPLTKGGGYTPDNIVPACLSCNCSKQDKPLGDWLHKRFGTDESVVILERIQEFFKTIN